MRKVAGRRLFVVFLVTLLLVALHSRVEARPPASHPASGEALGLPGLLADESDRASPGNPEWSGIPSDGTWDGFNPPGSTGMSAVYDPVNDRLVVHGGQDAYDYCSVDTWVLPLAGSQQWQRLEPSGTRPDVHYYQSAILDPARRRMLIFGGVVSCPPAAIVATNRVWALNLDGPPAWTEIAVAGVQPDARYWHTAIYDPPRDRMIVFGGRAGSTRVNDVWALVLGGTPTWTRLDVVGTPPTPRESATAVYDPQGDRMIVFGGWDGSYRNDTWELSLPGAPEWTPLPVSTPSPPGRCWHSAIMDGSANAMVAFGGVAATPGYLNDVWRLALGDTLAWSLVSAEGIAPRPRFMHSAAYDLTRGRMIVFGGRGTDPPPYSLRDTWALDLQGVPHWMDISPAPLAPAARSLHAAAQDLSRDQMVLFGGLVDELFDSSEVWGLSFMGVPNWSPIPVSGAPPDGRDSHTFVGDESRDQFIMFGGSDSISTVRSDLWRLSFSPDPAWTELHPSGPTLARTNHTAVFDAAGDRMLVFGGWDSNYSSRSADVWSLNLGGVPEWTKVVPLGGGPSARAGHSAIWDSPRARMVVFGGYGPTYMNDVWALDMSATPAWVQIIPTGTGPSPRWGQSAVYDAQSDRMVVFAGETASGRANEVWALSLGEAPAWTLLNPDGLLPPPRDGHSAVMDPTRGRMVVFGGHGRQSGSRGDTWWLTWPGTSGVDVGAPETRNLTLGVNRPNPFAHSTSLSYSLLGSADVTVCVHDLAGRLVARLGEGPRSPGIHEVSWDGRNMRGSRVASGIYLVRVNAGPDVQVRKILLSR